MSLTKNAACEIPTMRGRGDPAGVSCAKADPTEIPATQIARSMDNVFIGGKLFPGFRFLARFRESRDGPGHGRQIGRMRSNRGEVRCHVRIDFSEHPRDPVEKNLLEKRTGPS